MMINIFKERGVANPKPEDFELLARIDKISSADIYLCGIKKAFEITGAEVIDLSTDSHQRFSVNGFIYGWDFA